ncbi:hypothetical protein LPB85_16900 [Chryseobacterium sp. LC2016-27]|uniref:hypothetical protein n=1 Tax=Chryseobacterium sp. LC2016-27 TaxID=2897326 RepID=UPI001E431525|nr:hypothetical protein [Chryseobacterium sp. LC2016-27]MCD0457131.1 hypothetical protein [Chryseobacterium sp. LC2016-27]
MNNYAIDTAARFGEIPFVEFTKDLVTGVFDSLVEAHILQMEEYATFVNSLTQDLSTYINNTQDGVTFDQISEFVLNYELPTVNNSDLTTVLGQLQAPTGSPTPANPNPSQPATTDTWWGGLINGLAPAVSQLVDKVKDPSEIAGLAALDKYNNDVLNGANNIVVPTYKQIYDSIAALIASNKYGLLQTISKQGVMRLVVTEGEIETKITFSTWNNSSSGSDAGYSEKARVKTKEKRGVFGQIFKGRDKIKTRTVTVNTAKSYQRDSSGTKVDIFGRVLIKFKTDYAPLNG